MRLSPYPTNPVNRDTHCPSPRHDAHSVMPGCRGERYQLDRAKVRIDLDELERLRATTDPESEPAALGGHRAVARRNRSPAATTRGPTARYAACTPHSLICSCASVTHAWPPDDGCGALQVAEQAIALYELHEPSWRLALQAEHALGLRSSLTQRYEELTHTLDEQLGLQSSHETRMMYRQLLGQT